MIEFNLRSFQKYYKLKPTGLVDKETQTLLSKPRCGLPDIINDLKKKLAKLTRNITSHSVKKVSFIFQQN